MSKSNSHDDCSNASSVENITNNAKDGEPVKLSSSGRERHDLPKSNTDYGNKEYWEERFANEDEFEWLVKYEEIEPQLSRFIKSDSKILIVGCGNSSFSSDMYDAGYKCITNIDYSKNVIEICV